MLPPQLQQSALRNGWQLLTRPNELFHRGYAEYGGIFRVAFPGQKMVVLAGTDAMTAFRTMEKHGDVIPLAWTAFHNEFGTDRLIIDSAAATHAELRRSLAPGYSRQAASVSGLIGPVDLLLAQWARRRSVRLMPEMQRLFVQQASATLVNSVITPDVHDAMCHTFRYILRVSNGQWPKAMLLTPSYRRRRHAVVQYMTGVATELLTNPDGRDRTALSTALVTLHTQRSDIMTHNELVANLFIPLIAGIDTVAATTTIALTDILDRPDLHRKLAVEASDYFSDAGYVDHNPMTGMPRLWSAIQESMRLSPIAFGIQRTATRELEYKGFTIRKGDRIVVATAATHYSDQHFPHPTEFLPDRFLHKKAESSSGYAPFGRGAHECLGKNLAKIQILLTVGRMISACDLRLTGRFRHIEMPTIPPRNPSSRIRITVRTDDRKSPA
ncbi:cytochrome P450 [Nocardia amikacinitolerans]|uniref:cytochrome P450 n=1 Tax=Nocardia amikacinitolerans TaxID=756689 RepID=UPI0020A2AFF1|nr:cytochrome P450 [Nocardia amikacinitolerans]MCP2291899.1 Cytochrome P450 [Nocardia amikacinitolerans]